MSKSEKSENANRASDLALPPSRVPATAPTSPADDTLPVPNIPRPPSAKDRAKALLGATAGIKRLGHISKHPKRNRGHKLGGGAKVTPLQLEAMREKLGLFWSRGRIISHFSNEWGVTTQTATKWLDLLCEEIAQERKKESPHDRENFIESLRGYYQLCLEKGDMRAASAMFVHLAKIQGVYEPEELRVKHEGGIEFTVGIGDVDPKRVITRIRELLDKHDLDKLLSTVDMKVDNS